MFKLSLKYAVFCGGFLLLVFFLMMKLGLNPLINLNHLLFDLVVYGLFLFFAQKEFKTYYNEGILHLWQGMTIGFVIYAVASFLFVIGLLVFFQLDSDAIMNYQSDATLFLNEKADLYIKEFGKEGYDQQIEAIKSITAWDLVKSAGFKKIVAGMFVTPVISIILRKQPK